MTADQTLERWKQKGLKFEKFQKCLTSLPPVRSGSGDSSTYNCPILQSWKCIDALVLNSIKVSGRYALHLSLLLLNQKSLFISFLIIVGRFVPMIASHSLVKPNNNITTAIISIHGLNENAMAAYDSISTSVNNVDRASGEHPNNVLVVVPWFHRNSVHSSDWNPSSCQDISPSAQSFAWSANSSWVSGGDSILLDPNLSTGAADYSYVSSFGVLDDLYTTLTKPEMFPSLRHITYVGFSAGGQMINRYAWATEVGQVAAAPDVSKKRSRFQHTPTASAAEDKEAISYRKRVVQRLQKTDVSVRFIVSDASSYVYFDNFRPDASCRAALDSGPLHHCDRFAEHTSTWCGQFNTWKYGTVVLPGPHDGVSYVNAIARGEGAVAARTEQYR